MNLFRNALAGSLGTMLWTLFLGAVFTAGFYIFLFKGPVQDPNFTRFFTAHWVEYVETGLFFLAFAALLLKAFDVGGQYLSLDTTTLPTAIAGGERPEQAKALLEEVQKSADGSLDNYLPKRLCGALEHVVREGSADKLDEELKYLAEGDAIGQPGGYGLAQLIVWAIPMLGFLGTVMGITEALMNLSPEALVGAGGEAKDAFKGLLGGLSVAFDTTAIALVFAMALMFIKFCIEQGENRLLGEVDSRVGAMLYGRFQTLGSATDPNLASIQRMCEGVIGACDRLVTKQAELWQATIDAAHQQWSTLLDASGRQVESALVGALETSIASHAKQLTHFEQAAGERSLAHGEQLRTILTENAQILRAQQDEMVRTGAIMTRAVEVTGDVMKLQQVLHENLRALAGAKHFEETVMSLSAAIHLLTSRLTDSPSGEPLRLSPTTSTSRAA